MLPGGPLVSMTGMARTEKAIFSGNRAGGRLPDQTKHSNRADEGRGGGSGYVCPILP